MNIAYNNKTIQEALREACNDVGLVYKQIRADGKWHRTDIANDKRGKNDGSIMLFADGNGGFVRNWKGEDSAFFTNDGKTLTHTQKQRRQKQIEKTIAQAEQKRAEQHAKASKKARGIWKQAMLADGEHKYLKRKKVAAHGLRQNTGNLLVPIYGDNGLIQSIQYIGNDGKKLFLAGGCIAGGYFIIGKVTDTICIVEGYSTGASVYEATGHAVAIAFNSGNLKKVAISLKKQYPNTQFVICADNDETLPINIGLNKATEASQAVNGLLAIPDWENDFNDLHCAKGLEVVKVCICSAKTPPELEKEESKPSGKQVASRVVDFILPNAKLYRDKMDKAYLAIKNKGCHKLFTLNSTMTSKYIRHTFYQLEGKGINKIIMADILDMLAAKAEFDSETIDVSLRFAQHNSTIYLDLCNESWEVVHITKDGWKVVTPDNPFFIRGKATMPLPSPIPGGDINSLWKLVNIKDTKTQKLLLAWLVHTFFCKLQCPVIILHGEQGSAKSTTSKTLRNLVDPNRNPLRTMPSNERDLFISTQNNAVLVFDNMGSVSKSMSDNLCRLVTGGSFATRTLYTDSEETIIEAMCPMIMNGIGDFITRQDLIDRALFIQMPTISEQNRMTEQEFNQSITQLHPELLGALLSVVSQAMKELPNITLNKVFRMADFTKTGIAVEKSMNWPKGSFMSAYKQNRINAITSGLESEPIVDSLESLANHYKNGWQGTSTNLLLELNKRTNKDVRYIPTWPKTPHSLSQALNRLTPALRHKGIVIGRERTQHVRLITIRKEKVS